MRIVHVDTTDWRMVARFRAAQWAKAERELGAMRETMRGARWALTEAGRVLVREMQQSDDASLTAHGAD